MRLTHCTPSRHYTRAVTSAPDSRFELPGALTGPWNCLRTLARL